jgi:hypothetical protein
VLATETEGADFFATMTGPDDDGTDVLLPT